MTHLWRRTKEYIDARLGMHILHFEEMVSGAQHRLQIFISHESCPLCGHAWPVTNTGELDPKKLEEQELANLRKGHDNMHTYAKKWGVQIRKKKA